MSPFKKLSLLILISLPFLLGSSSNFSSDNNPFTLSNYTTFSPGSEVTVNLYTSGNISTEFKLTLLKITNPIDFFSGLNSSYSFDIWGRDKEILLKYTEKVREWNANIDAAYSYGRGNLKIGKIDEPGIYIIQAIRGEQVAYCSVVVSDYAIVYKNSAKQLLAFITNVKTSEFSKNVKFTLVYNKITQSQYTDRDGLALFKVTGKLNQDYLNRPLLIAQTGKETLISNPYFYFGEPGATIITAYTYTNQPIYRPGQEVFFKSILRQKEGNELRNAEGIDFSVSIKSPKNKEVYSKSIKSDDLGTISGSVKLEGDAELGNYSIIISKGENNYYGSFEVQEYKKPEYLVNIELPKSNYANHDEITGKVKADYYFGSPVTNGTVALKIYKKYYWRPWWYWSDYSWFYRSFDKISPYNWRELTFVKQMDGSLNSKGEFDFTYQVNEEQNADYVYVISAEVTDASRRAITGSSNIYITRGSFSIFTSPDKYITETGKPVILKVNSSDFNDKPVSTPFKVVFNYPDDRGNTIYNRTAEKDSLFGQTDNLGKAIISYMPRNLKTGYYNYMVIAKDEKGREITAQSSFFYGESNYYNYSGQGVEIVTDKDSYDKGDSLTAYIFLPSSNTEMLITYESNDIFYYKKITANERSIVIKEKLDGKFSPSFNISVTFMKDGKFFNNSKQVGVLAKDKFLNISILPDKKEYKPGDKAAYKVMVKDFKGNAVKNTSLSFGVIDESIYAIKEDETPDIKSFFYAPQYSYIPTYNSYFYIQSNGQSRQITSVDKYFVEKGQMEQRGNGRLYGKIKNKEGKSFAGIRLVLDNKNNFYIATTDTSGNYEFNKMKPGDYSLYYFNSANLLTLINKVTVNKDRKYDAVIDLPFEQFQMVLGNTGGIINLRGGRTNTNAITLDGAPRMMEKSMTTSKAEYVEAVVRSNFADAAFWAPDVRTDANGIAEVKFKMPDNLTTWRTSVKGVNINTEVGQEINKTITRKELLIRMETPRFFRAGDEITISTIVHNYLNEKKKTKITFKADNLTLLRSNINTPGYSTNVYNQKDGLYEITVNKDTELRIDWVVKVDIPTGEAKLNAEALTNTESDALQLKVPIIPKGMKEVKSIAKELSDQKEENLQFSIPQDADLRSAKFSFTAVPTIAGTLLKALDDLAGYPYGCVEQTMSRFLPTIIVANTFNDLKMPLKSNTLTEMPNMVDAGLKRLYSFQHDDGGWGWWTNDNTHPYMTAYVIYGMNLAKQAGYILDQEVYRRGIENLNSQLNNNSQIDPTTLTFMLYALSSSKDEKYNSTIFQKIREMDMYQLNAYSISLNIITLININEREYAKKYIDKLISMSTSKAGMVFWSGKEWHYNWQDDIVQSTSFAVKALIKSGIKSDLISKAVNWLMMEKQGYSWRSTQETAAVIFALSDYLKTTNELNPDYTYSIYLNDKLIVNKKISTDDVYNQPEEIKIDGLKDKNLINGNNFIKIVKEGSGKLYFSGLNQYYIDKPSVSSSKQDFNVRREYYLLRPEQREGKIVYIKNSFDGELKSGDELLVKTFVKTDLDKLQYFILEDMLPSGFEPIKDENKYEIEGESNYHIYNYRSFRPWRWFYADKEYRDQKVSFFVTNVNREMEFSYLIKAQIPGKVTVSPAQAYLMYYPEVNGNSDWVKLNIRDK